MTNLEKVYNSVEVAIDKAFSSGDFDFNFMQVLQSKNIKRNDIKEFLNSSLYISLEHQVEELGNYLSGEKQFLFLKESYDWIGKSKCIEIQNHLIKIIEDAKEYEQSKKPGRKKKSATTNK